MLCFLKMVLSDLGTKKKKKKGISEDKISFK